MAAEFAGKRASAQSLEELAKEERRTRWERHPHQSKTAMPKAAKTANPLIKVIISSPRLDMGHLSRPRPPPLLKSRPFSPD